MNLHINDRSDLDEVVAVTTKDGRKITRRMDLVAWTGCHRTDIVLINGTRTGLEHYLSVTKDGFAGQLWILDILTDTQYEEVMRIAAKMRQNAIDFPPAGKLLAHWTPPTLKE